MIPQAPGQAGGSQVTGREPPAKTEQDQISQNIEAVLDFYSRAEKEISLSQRVLERISRFIGRPLFLGIMLFFMALWMLANTLLPRFGLAEFE